MLGTILGFFTTPTGIVSGIIGVVVVFLLKKIDNDKIKGWIKAPFDGLAAVVEKALYGAGVTCTVGLAKWPLTSGIWNKTLEPYLVDLLDNVLNGVVDGIEEVINGAKKGLFAGLHSDNKK